MGSEQYVLKHSRISIVFQLGSMLLISIILYLNLETLYWMLSSVIMAIMLYHFRKKAQVQYLYQLDRSLWSVQHHASSKIYRLTISHWIDHHFYIVIYFSDPEIKNRVIWYDQMELTQWKKLKIRAKLN